MRCLFENRRHAGRLLAHKVVRDVHGPCVVAAIPRGGLVVALPIAEALEAPLTIAFVRKVCLPEAPELSIGAVDEDGHLVLGTDQIAALHSGSAEVRRARDRALREIVRQRSRYGALPLAEMTVDHTIVLVDDGMATGLTMRSAIAYARRHGAPSVVVATPCASLESVHRLESLVDRLVTLGGDEPFTAVGQLYEHYEEVSDETVMEVLERARETLESRERSGGRRRSAPHALLGS